MAAINDLVRQIENPELRQRIQQELAKMSKQKKFGLVFEEHLPENTPLYDLTIRSGIRVARRDGDIKDCYQVLSVKDGVAECIHLDDKKELVSFPVGELIAVAQFGEPIYPYLKPLDSICNAPDSELWHTLIQADNYHALQLLVYLYGGKVDCIYIDPPYNTGARDWKYNNDYVDGNDSYRHSKWLSFMKKRLQLAKKLLNPKDSVLIVTIDEKEYLHLGCLLEEMFPEARIQMISSVINSAGVAKQDKFSRTNEYLFFIMIGHSVPTPLNLSSEWLGNIKVDKEEVGLYWNQLMRSGSSPLRKDHPLAFYPIVVDSAGTKILRIGDCLEPGVDRNTVKEEDGTKNIWPIRSNGEEGRWQLGRDKLAYAIQHGYVRLGKFTKNGMAITYLAQGEQQKVENGTFKIIGHRADGSIIEEKIIKAHSYIPGSQWNIQSHNATYFGTQLLNKFIGDRFSYPKSLYAVHDTIRFFVANKPNALIVDFFAGSGTTLHAVNLLNKEDDGNRRCIMVTNNEVSEDEAKTLKKKGHKQGDKEWEELGIAQYVTWPRTTCSIKGTDIKGEPLKGSYFGCDTPMAEGFKANANFFKLGFLDKTSVSLGRQFKELLPLLWMKAGAKGECPSIETDELPKMLVCEKNHFAVLLDEKVFAQFVEEVEKSEGIRMIYLITDSNSMYREMARSFPKQETCQLYRDYLDNFRINITR